MPEMNNSKRLSDLGFVALLLVKKGSYRFLFTADSCPNESDKDEYLEWQLLRLGSSAIYLRNKYGINIMGTWFSFGIVTISTSGHDNEPLFAITFTQNKEDIGCWTMEELLKESNNDLETWV